MFALIIHQDYWTKDNYDGILRTSKIEMTQIMLHFKLQVTNKENTTEVRRKMREFCATIVLH